MEKKFREFTVHKVLPENGTPPFWAAEEGDRFVEQDSWIGEQFHVIEHAAFTELLAIAKAMANCLGCDEYDNCNELEIPPYQCEAHQVYGRFIDFKKKAGIE